VGRWTAVDPVKQYFDVFIYCGDNPINRTDPDGQQDDAEAQFWNPTGIDPSLDIPAEVQQEWANRDVLFEKQTKAAITVATALPAAATVVLAAPEAGSAVVLTVAKNPKTAVAIYQAIGGAVGAEAMGLWGRVGKLVNSIIKSVTPKVNIGNTDAPSKTKLPVKVDAVTHG
jgi:hypothetical protein